jgi:hypothetical protein
VPSTPAQYWANADDDRNVRIVQIRRKRTLSAKRAIDYLRKEKLDIPTPRGTSETG